MGLIVPRFIGSLSQVKKSEEEDGMRQFRFLVLSLALLVCGLPVAWADSLSVRLSLADPPAIYVEGKTIEPLHRDQLGDVLHGAGDLKKRVEGLHSCGRVDGVHLSDDDQLSGKLHGTFAKYGWQPARLTHEARAARIVAVTAEPVIVADQLCENPSHVAGFECAHEISREVTNTVEREAHWDVESTVTQTVDYEIGVGGVGKVGGSTSLSFSAGYGESSGTSEAVTVGSTSGAKTTLAPGESVVLELSLTAGKIEAQVDYRQKLDGGVFYHYKHKCDGHYLWYASLRKLYPAADLQSTQSETLRVNVYSHARVSQRDVED